MGDSYLVKKITEPVDWTVDVPGSKSMTNRALLMAALSDGTVELEGILLSDDSRYFLECLGTLGFAYQLDTVRKWVRINGCGASVPKKEAEIYVGSAGTAARFLTAMLGFSDGTYQIRASEQMKRRPMEPLFAFLRGIGAEITCLEKEGFLPIRIRGIYAGQGVRESTGDTPLSAELDISESTQFLSALLLVSPMIKQGLCVHIISEKTDGSYIRITRKMMEAFGAKTFFDGKNYKVPAGTVYCRENYAVEPDMSAACYFYAAAAITGGRALVRGVKTDNTQGDLKFLRVLEKMGCLVTAPEEGIAVQGPKKGELRGVTVDMNDFSDQALTLAAIAPFAKEKVRMERIGHIRRQECDRIHAITAELTKLGIKCEEEADAVTVYPGRPKMGTVETYEDHRVAMAFSLIGLCVEGIRIADPDCCKKTFAEYFSTLSRLTGKTEG